MTMEMILSTSTESIIARRPNVLGGSVRKLRQDRGYGFIAGDDGIDYFFHWTGMDRDSLRDFRGLCIYDRVEFEYIMQPDKGPRAIKIRVAE
jgi:cold shock CspA family protein